MSLICKQPFIKVLREIVGIEQKYIETKYNLYLYETKIVTPTQTFSLNEVLDVSYRESTSKFGTLYLHTNQGVFPFYVGSNPVTFIRSVKKLKHDQN